MKFTTNKALFNAAIGRVIGGVSKSPTMHVLSNLLIDVTDGFLTLVATDLEIQIKTSIPVKMIESGSITVNAKKMADIVKAASPDAEIMLSVSGDWLNIDIGTGAFKLAVIDAHSFPLMTVESDANLPVKIAEKHLYSLIEKTQFSMANQDVRYFLNGLMIQVDGSQVTAVATDGHRLAYAIFTDSKLDADNQQVIVPRKMVAEMLKALNRDSVDDVSLTLRDSQIEIQIGENHMISKLIDGKYPDYMRVIPKANSNTLVVPKNDLKQVLQRAAILANEKVSGAYFHLSQDRLIVESSNSEHESSKETMIVGYDADDMKIAFNIVYLAAILAVIETDDIRMEIEAAESSVLIKQSSIDGIESKYVLMPMKI